jgi:uncharacterized secreted protein with C-terminal beta-propeller domain
MYNNISYNKDYYTIEKLMNSRKQNSVVCENDNCMWLDFNNNLLLLLFQISILVFLNYDMPFSTGT